MGALTLKQLLEDESAMKYLSFPLLPKGAVMVIGAPSKAKKSWLAMNLAYGLAEGSMFLKWQVSGQQKVLYVEQEIGRWGVRDRFRKIHHSLKGSFAEDNLVVATKGGKIPYSLDPDSLGFQNLLRLVDEMKPDVIILDPLREFHTQDEDNSTGMSQVFKSITKLQENTEGELVGRTIIVVHHTGKRSEFRERNDPEALRGSSKIFDAGDSYIMLEPGKSNDNRIVLHFKLRHAEAPNSVTIDFDGDRGTFSVKGQPEE